MAILWPLEVAVAWVMVMIHKALVFLGMGTGAGPAWVLSIVGLTIVVRILIMPLFFKQIRASRGMQLMQPEMQALQAKYKGKKDPASQQRMQEEMMALYRKHGTNPFSSCLPILVQMPIFFALFRVLANLGKIADGSGYNGHLSIGPLTEGLAEEVQSSSLLGASLSSSFMNSTDVSVKIVTLVMIILMSATQFYTMGQQFWTIHRMPAPGSEAEKKMKARQAARRARKGLPPLEEKEAAEAASTYTGGQRVQPVRKDRRKNSGAGAGASTAGADESGQVAAESQAEVAEPEDEVTTTSGGLTAEEIARRRYEKRARQRQQAAAKRKAQKKKRR